MLVLNVMTEKSLYALKGLGGILSTFLTCVVEITKEVFEFYVFCTAHCGTIM